MSQHIFKGKWISDRALACRSPRNVFHRQLDKPYLPKDEEENSHVLFRKKLFVEKSPKQAIVYISADDYYKLYINGSFVCQGPAPSYHFRYNYNKVDITEYLKDGENTFAVHTYYQGLINRVWQSGDFRHGLILDICADGECLLCSDESFLTHRHTGYSAIGKAGYDTQFLERYDSRSKEDGFEACEFDDSYWENAVECQAPDRNLKAQDSKMLVFEEIAPVSIEKKGSLTLLDFGAMYVGALSASAAGNDGETVKIKYAEELNEDGSLRYKIRANCNYAEEWILSGKEDRLCQFDYKTFRYASFECDNAELSDIKLVCRHYPFELKAKLSPIFAGNETAERIWELCVRSQKYGVQETIQDCTDREKGFYLGDGCYTAFANYMLTNDDSMVRKLIDDAFSSSFITKGLVTCMSCSFMQEIAEYPLILTDLLLWHCKKSRDIEYLKENIEKMRSVLEFYRENYEKELLLRDLDRWCVVEWPDNYRDGYDVDIEEGKICHEAHISINAYYYRAIDSFNRLCEMAGLPIYREAEPIRQRIIEVFYDKERHLFCDGEEHKHISLVGNIFPYAFDICREEKFEESFKRLLQEKGEDKTFLFTSFPLLFKFTREKDTEALKRLILHEGTWQRMLKEGATATFEGWGKDCKWNTSLFHLTMSSAVIFMAEEGFEQ